jgi:23S rRNA (pseudouridine1915-N3)-methyltransferase
MHTLASRYLKRIKKYVSSELIEVEPGAKGAGRRLRKIITQKDHVVALDEGGKTFSSRGFAGYLEGLLGRFDRITFIIGDAGGFPRELADLIKEKISLSPLTVQHDLARILFLEQLYRAFTILKGEPYHK